MKRSWPDSPVFSAPHPDLSPSSQNAYKQIEFFGVIPLADRGLLDSLEPKCNPPRGEVIILDSFKSPVLGSILCPHPCLSFFSFKCMLSCCSLIYPYKSLLNPVGNREVQTHKVVVIFSSC